MSRGQLMTAANLCRVAVLYMRQYSALKLIFVISWFLCHKRVMFSLKKKRSRICWTEELTGDELSPVNCGR